MKTTRLGKIQVLAGALLALSLAACSPSSGPSGAGTPSGLTAHRRPTHSPTPAPSPTTSGRPGRCHYRQTGTDPLMVLPDPTCTPGATNPQVTQATIKQTICKTGWTATIRPPVAVTQAIKVQSLSDYGLPQSAMATTELDHLLPLEVGGAPADPKNLWVEPNYATPHPTKYDHNPKDPIEFAVRNAVCSGKVTLAAAQQALLADWTTAPKVLGVQP